MADEEVEQFESTDAGAALCFPQQAGTVRKGGHIVIKGRPCKVSDVSTSKTGKHGHAKCHFVAIDIFTGKKLEELCPSSHNCEVPHVNRQDFTLLDVTDDGFVSLMDDAGNEKADLKLPPNDAALADQIEKDFNDGKELVVSVLKSMGEEVICAVKEASNK
jgi:translation initiation factor 5A